MKKFDPWSILYVKIISGIKFVFDKQKQFHCDAQFDDFQKGFVKVTGFGYIYDFWVDVGTSFLTLSVLPSFAGLHSTHLL